MTRDVPPLRLPKLQAGQDTPRRKRSGIQVLGGSIAGARQTFRPACSRDETLKRRHAQARWKAPDGAMRCSLCEATARLAVLARD